MMHCLKVIIFVVAVLQKVRCLAEYSNSGQVNYFLDPLQTLSQLEEKVQLKSLSEDEANLLTFWNSSWPTIIQAEHESKYPHAQLTTSDRPYIISSECAKSLIHLVAGLMSRKPWALEMIDASGKFPSGLLLGNIQWIGSYVECVDASSKNLTFSTSGNKTAAVQGEYCLMNLGSSDTETMGQNVHLGICIPRTCNTTDAKALVNLLLLGFTNRTHATNAACTDNSTIPLDSAATAVIVILCIFGVLLLLGTCVDLLSNRHAFGSVNEAAGDKHERGDDDDDPLLDDSAPNNQAEAEVVVQSLGSNGMSSETLRTVSEFVPPPVKHRGRVYKFLIAFSVLSNAKKIFSTESSKSNQPLQALHGIRLISMTWVILGHTYLSSMTLANNYVTFLDVLKRFTFQAVINASVSVDTFFVLSGTLVSYFLLKEMRAREGLRNISWAKFYFHRFWRLTPLLAMVLAFYTSLFKYFGSGPYWPRTSDKNCVANWWTVLIYINNLVRNRPCLNWTWYLANDMQFFLLSPLFIVLLYKWSLLGSIVIFIFMLTSSITTGVLTYVKNFPSSMVGLVQGVSNYQSWFDEIYITPWCRINPYLIGIVVGYILFRTNFRLKLPKGVALLLWLIAAVINLTVLYGLWNVAKGVRLTSSINALYASLHRTAWAVGIGWVIVACSTGNGSFINDLLSLPVIMPLSRLTYAAYLVHPIIMAWYSSSHKVPIFVDDATISYLFVGNLVFSYAAAFVVSIVCEAPMINLERSFIRDRKSLEQRK